MTDAKIAETVRFLEDKLKARKIPGHEGTVTMAASLVLIGSASRAGADKVVQELTGYTNAEFKEPTDWVITIERKTKSIPEQQLPDLYDQSISPLGIHNNE